MTAIINPARVISCPTRSNGTRRYGTRFRLFTPVDGHDTLRFLGAPIVHENHRCDLPIDSVWRQVVDNVFSVEGIGSIILRPFEVNISRSSAFDWEELDPYLTYLIASADPLQQYSVLPTPPSLPRPQRIRWFDTRSTDSRHYGLTVRLFTPAHDFDTERSSLGQEWRTLTPEVGALFERLSKIDGISYVNLRPFEANICKYGHFSWAELHEEILEALRACFSNPQNVQLHNRYEWD